MQIQIQGKNFRYDLDNFRYMNRNSAFRVFTPPLSRSELCEVVFVPVIEGGDFTRIYSLGYYNNFGEAMDVVNQIYAGVRNGQKLFVMPEKADKADELSACRNNT